MNIEDIEVSRTQACGCHWDFGKQTKWCKVHKTPISEEILAGDIQHKFLMSGDIIEQANSIAKYIRENYTPNSQIQQSNEEITFDATGAYWEEEKHGWVLVAIQNGKVIWDEKHLAEDISNVVYSETGEYTGDVIRQKDTEIASKYYFEQYKLERKDNE